MSRLIRLISTLLSLAAAAPSLAGEVDLTLSCPVNANPPANPANPQATTCVVVDSSWTCTCRVYWANQGDALTNVVFTLVGEALPDLDLVDPLLDDGDNTAMLLQWPNLPSSYVNNAWLGWVPGPDRRVLKRNLIAGINGSAPVGYTRFGPYATVSPYGTAAVDVGLASMPVGLTGQFDVTIVHPATTSPAPEVRNLTLVVRADQPVDFEPQVAPLSTPQTTSPGFAYTGAVHQEGLTTSARVRGAATVRPQGDGAFGTIHRSIDQWVLLPYWNGSAVVADDAYDPLDPDHELIVDLGGLVATVTSTCGLGAWCSPTSREDVLDAAIHADLAAPDSGVNTNRRIRVEPNTNRLIARPGFQGYSSTTRLAWHAPLRADYLHLAVGDQTIPGTHCARSDTYGVASCVTTSFRFIAVPPLTASAVILYHGNSQGFSEGGAFVWARAESGALRRDRLLRASLDIDLTSFASLAPLGDLEIIFQVGGSDVNAAFGDSSTGRDVSLTSLGFGAAAGWGGWKDPHAIWVTTATPDHTREDDIAQRVLPAPSDPSWVLCGSSTGATRATCNDAALAAHGTSLAAVTHVRVQFPAVIAGNNGGRFFLEYTGVAPSARVSIDASAPSRTDLRRASFGAKGNLSFQIDGATRSLVFSDTLELDPRLRAGVRVVRAASGVAQLNTTYSLPCGFENFQESNAYTPVLIDFDLPPGFEPTLPIAPPNTAVVPGPATPGDPAWSATVSYDPGLRRVSAEVIATNPMVGQLLRPTGPYNFTLRVGGQLAPGTPSPTVSVCRVRARYDDINGDSVDFDQTLPTSYTLNSVFPALRIAATPNRALIERNGIVGLDLELHNEVFDDVTGLAIPNGARARADEVALRYRVPREGDFPGIEDGLIQAGFVAATSADASGIYVSVSESPTPAAGNALTLANGWRSCATPPAVCDAAALASAGVPDPAAVRWVVFRFPIVEMTDGVLRSPTPGPGPGHVDVPYRGHVTLRDRGSVGELGEAPKLVAFLDARTLSTATPAIGDEVAVAIDTSCDASIPGVGFAAPEVCDALDNDCDDLFNEELARAVDCPGGCPPTATETCDGSGTWVGGCNFEPLACDTVPYFGIATGPGGERGFRCDRAGDGTLTCITGEDGRLLLFDEVVCQ